MGFSIDQIYVWLSSDNDEETQQRGIAEAEKITCLSVLIMPFESKLLWENCAKVLIAKPDKILQPYFGILFEWLKDMNWPGAYLIYDRLRKVFNDDFLLVYQYSLALAHSSGDHAWEQSLQAFGVDYILDLIDRNNSEEQQMKGIELAREIKKINVFLRPTDRYHNQNVWENCATILAKRSDEELSPYLVELLEWMQDMNWPGAFCILDRLKQYADESSFQIAFYYCMTQAKLKNDTVWERNLCEIL